MLCLKCQQELFIRFVHTSSWTKVETNYPMKLDSYAVRLETKCKCGSATITKTMLHELQQQHRVSTINCYIHIEDPNQTNLF